QLHLVFLVAKLKLAELDSFAGWPRNKELPPVPDTPGDVQWEVNKIIEANTLLINGKLWYFVKWKGYGDKDNKWVKHTDMFADEAIANFYCRYPNTPRHIAAATFDSFPFR
ncbi:hypothetical protein K438DRAFT_1537092, partial [Mycena galopus ATCC 62051]